MNRRRFLAGCSAGLGFLAGCSGDGRDGSGRTTTAEPPAGTPTVEPSPAPVAVDPLDGSWRSHRHDAANTGATDDPGPADEPPEIWHRATATGRPVAPPAAADGALFVTTGAGALYAREAADGSVRWTRSLPVGAGVDPVAGGGTVAVAGNTSVVGLGTDAGEERWRVSLDGPVVGLAATDGGIVAATGSGLAALGPDDGTREWRRSADGIVTPPGTGGGAVAVGTASGEVLAFDAAAGERHFRASVGAEPAFAPVVAGGRVYAAADTSLVALDRDGGDRRWDHSTTHPVAGRPAATADAVYLATVDDDAESPPRGTPPGDGPTPTPPPTDTRWFGAGLISLSSADGTERWRAGETERYNFTSGAPEGLPIVPAGGRIVVGLGGTLRAYDAATGDVAWSTGAGGVRPAAVDGVLSTGTVGIDAAEGSVVWRFESGTSIAAQPAIVGNTVYAGSDDYYVHALAANAGTVEWTARTDGPVGASPAVGGNAVYVGTGNGSLFAFDRADGSERWRARPGGQVHSPVLRDRTVYVGSFSSTLFAFDAADGSRRWLTDVEGDRFVALTLTVAEGAVYAGANGDLRAFDAADGTERWRAAYGDRSRVQSTPVVGGGRVFVNLGDSLRAIDAGDGRELWSRETGGSNRPPVVRDGVVYAPGDAAVHAFDAADGEDRWHVPVGEDLALAAAGGAVYGAGYDTPLLALDPADGTELWRRGDLEVTTAPSVAGEYLFVGDGAGRIRALGPEPSG